MTKPTVDPDNDTLTHRYRWYADDKPTLHAVRQNELSNAHTREKQTWFCEVQAFDGHLASKPTRSPKVVVRNSAPSKPKVSVAPDNPRANDDLVCQLDTPSRDADLDAITYRYAWRVNGMRWRHPRHIKRMRHVPENVVPKEITRRNQVWQCTVTPHDGEVPGMRAKATTKVLNSPPTPPRVRIVPFQPRAGEDLTCEIVRKAVDADKNSIKYVYKWLKSGETQRLSGNAPKLPGHLVSAPDTWRCTVTPTDGITEGPSASSQEVIIGQ